MTTQQSRQQDLPPDWKWAKLGDVCELKYGSSLPARLRVEGPFVVYGSNGPVGSHTQALIDGPAIIVGRKGSVGAVHISEQPCWPIDTTYYVDEHSANIDLAWLKLTLDSLHLGSLDKSSAIPGLNRSDVYRQSIPLPPLPEQRRIVAVPEPAVGRRGAGQEKAATERLEAAQALREAFVGQLLENHGSRDWSKVRLLDLCETKGQYGTSRKSNNVGTGVPVLGMGNIRDGRIVWDNLKHADLDLTELNKFRLQPGDLLFNRTNSAELVGKTAVYNDAVEAAFASYLIRFRLIPERAAPRFVSTYINSSLGKSFIQQKLNRAIGQANISASVMHDMLIPTPSLQEQLGICKLLDGLEDEASRLLSATAEDLRNLDSITSALLRRAFSGEV